MPAEFETPGLVHNYWGRYRQGLHTCINFNNFQQPGLFSRSFQTSKMKRKNSRNF